MGLILKTDDKGAKIFRKDGVSKNGKNYSLYSIAVSSKDMSGNWTNGYIDCRFKSGVSINNKTVINIKNAFPTVSEYNGNTKVSWMITEFDIISDGETPVPASSDDGFMNISQEESINLPFN